MLNALLWVPLGAGLAACLVPRRAAGWVACAGALATLALAVAVLTGFDAGGGLQHEVDVEWIPGLGIHYALGVDGLNVFLVVLTALVWPFAIAFAALRSPERPRLYFLMFGLAETATLGAFLAQDLLLFVLFFDLMLVPFYFLFGAWGGRGRVAATIKMIVYTLVGSLLMLVAAVATGVLAADGGEVSFALADLDGRPLAEGSQHWLFWFFAAAFLVKMPAFLVHGWMPDAYRVAPLPALAVFSAVLSKVGAYGFLRVVLPLFPDATIEFQEVLLVLGLASILYGSVMAAVQTNVRLVAGYSSIAQLGFITMGVFALRPDGADGAILQMVNHGLVVAPLIFVIALLAERAGTDDLREMGGIATRAPVLAALFLIVALALLAMPGSANFIGELYILNALFQTKVAYAVVAALGVPLAAYYALRLYQRTMHNRRPEPVEARELGLRDAAALAPLVACILALALYPQFVLRETDPAATQAVAAFSGGDATAALPRPGGGDE